MQPDHLRQLQLALLCWSRFVLEQTALAWQLADWRLLAEAGKVFVEGVPGALCQCGCVLDFETVAGLCMVLQLDARDAVEMQRVIELQERSAEMTAGLRFRVPASPQPGVNREQGLS